MKLLITGDYKPTYNRNYTLVSGLKQRNDVQVEEYPLDLSQLQKEALNQKLAWADIIYLPPFTHKSIRLLRSLTSKAIVFDPLISNYMSKVYDFKKYSKYSPRAIKNYVKEKKQFKAADLILCDTKAHQAYLSDLFNIAPDKFQTVYIGANTALFKPSGPNLASRKIIAGFYGSFIPLQGIEKIMEAATLLKDNQTITFQLIGEGRLLAWAKEEAERNGLNNVEFLGWQDYHKLAELINNFDLALGIFGDSIKTNLVIPNKIYHYAACGKTILSRNTSAINEVFTDNENILLTDGSGRDLADKIVYAAKKELGIVGKHAAELIQSTYNERLMAESFIQILKTKL